MLKRLSGHVNRGNFLGVVFIVSVVLMTVLSRQLKNFFKEANGRSLLRLPTAQVD